MVLPLLPPLTNRTKNDWRVLRVSRLAYALANLLSGRRVQADKGTRDGRCASKELWTQLEPTEGRIEPHCGLPTETSAKRWRVEQLEFKIIISMYLRTSLILSASVLLWTADVRIPPET